MPPRGVPSRAGAPLRVVSAADGSIVAETLSTFWAPPSISETAFDSTGTTIRVVFDQATDRAGMSAAADRCSLLLDKDPGLGQGSRCVWQTDAVLGIFTGRGATVTPGATLALRLSAGGGGLRSANGLSGPSESTAVIGAPAQPVAPTVLIKGADVVDPCSGLEVPHTTESSDRFFSMSPSAHTFLSRLTLARMWHGGWTVRKWR